MRFILSYCCNNITAMLCILPFSHGESLPERRGGKTACHRQGGEDQPGDNNCSPSAVVGEESEEQIAQHDTEAAEGIVDTRDGSGAVIDTESGGNFDIHQLIDAVHGGGRGEEKQYGD